MEEIDEEKTEEFAHPHEVKSTITLDDNDEFDDSDFIVEVFQDA